MTAMGKGVIRRPGEGKVMDFQGQRLVIKAGDEQTGNAYDFTEIVFAPHFTVPLHTHQNEEEATFVLEGEMTIRVGDETVTVGPGGYVLGPRGIPHDLRNDSDNPLKVIVMTSPPLVERLLEEVAAAGDDAEKIMAITKSYGVEFL